MKSTSPPAWLVITLATAVALVLAGGTVALLIIGRPVPDRLWDLDMMVGGAYFVGGPFSVVFAHQAANQMSVMDTVNHTIAALREAVAGLSGGKTMTGTSRDSP